jgi:hypothetical protein
LPSTWVVTRTGAETCCPRSVAAMSIEIMADASL